MEQERMPLALFPTNTPTKHVRRKNSCVFRVDSSEELPSPHDSVFDALYISTTNSEESHKYKDGSIGLRDIIEPEVTDGRRCIENSRALDQHAIDDSGFLYGHGTVLETITERKSNGTINTLVRTKSMDDIHKLPLLGHRNSFYLAKRPRRQKSFSLDDLTLMKFSYHQACAEIERPTQECMQPPEVYAQAKCPTHAPLNRPPTPEGMPSWSAAQNMPRPLRARHHSSRRTRLHLQRLFGLPLSFGTSTQDPVPDANSLRLSTSGPATSRIAPRFRPPRSVYPELNHHPFNAAPIAKAEPLVASTSASAQEVLPKARSKVKRKLGQRVRFTASATARDSEINHLQTAIESTSVSAIHPIPSMQTDYVDLISRRPSGEAHCHHHRGLKRATDATNDILNHANTSPPSIEYTFTSLDFRERHAESILVQLSPSPSSERPISAAVTSAWSLGVMNSEVTYPISTSSRTQLMSSANTTGSPISQINSTQRETSNFTTPVNAALTISDQKQGCWKCAATKLITQLEAFWTQTASFLCFVCCGFEIDEERILGNRETSESISGSWLRRIESSRPREIVVEATPLVA